MGSQGRTISKAQGAMRWLLIALVTFAAVNVVDVVEAHSKRANPLRKIAYTSDANIDIVRYGRDATQRRLQRRSDAPPQVLSSDSIRLSMRAFNQTFFLHLDPNDHIVPPEGAHLNVWDTDPLTGQEILQSRSHIPRDQVRAYHGVVVHPSWTSKRMYEDGVGVSRTLSGIPEQQGVVGDASILLHDDGSSSVDGSPRFEGAFTWRGNQHTIQTSRNFHTGRQAHDPAVQRRSMEMDHLIIHRDSDLMTDAEAEQWVRRRGENALTDQSGADVCSHDGRDFNVNNHLFLTDSNNDEFSRSPLSFFTSAEEREGSSLGSAAFLRRGLAMLDMFGSQESSPRGISEGYIGADYEQIPRGVEFSYDLSPEMSSLSRRQTGSDSMGNGGNSSYLSAIGNTSGCPKSAMVVYVGMASDCTFTQANGGEVANTSATLLNMMNTVSNIYRTTFNVSIGVVELDVRTASCPSTASANVPWNVGCDDLTIDQRLSAFSKWRGAQSANGTGLWHLLTACSTSSTSGEIGVAWLGTLCKTDATSSGSDTVSGTGVTSNTNRNAQVVAHEMGHNFGAIHDCMSGCALSSNRASQSNGATCCPQSTSSCNDNDAHIMSPVASTNTLKFSQCSIGNICSMLSGGLNTDCVTTPGQRNTLSTQQCGNGILEPGEECDAGPNGSSCCSSQCKLTSGSQCDPTGSPCCSSSCKFAASTTLCRAAKDSSSCDTPEYCTGSSATCPDDKYEANGKSCGGNGLACANGRCTSRDLQCQSQTSGSQSYTKACPVRASQSCSLACQGDSSSLTCTLFQTNFIDGTPCGYGGYCQNGSCNSSGWQSTFRSWYRNNLNISIPVTIVIGIIVLLILAAIARRCCCPGAGRNRRGKQGAAAAGRRGSRFRRNDMGSGQGYQPPPPPMRNSNGYPTYGYAAPPGAPPSSDYPQGPPPTHQGHTNWVDPSAYNGR
ncbi:unnamed protein product [Parajaminaea phylloscopi]